jgi:ketosteroid isomerase-like protein
MRVDHRALLERFVAAMNRREYDAVEEIFTDDLVQEYPQSGEVIRGRRNFRSILENYPSGLPDDAIDLPSLRVAATDQPRVVAPLFTVVRVEGAGDVGNYNLRTRYPDGSTWWTIGFYELRDGRIARATVFFAPEFEAPEWRASFVERRTAPQT